MIIAVDAAIHVDLDREPTYFEYVPLQAARLVEGAREEGLAGEARDRTDITST